MTVDERTIEFSFIHADVRDVTTDVLVLKYAQAFYGADAAVAERLAFNPDFTPSAVKIPAGAELLCATHGTIAAPRALFLGVRSLARLEYEDLHVFGERAVTRALALPDPPSNLAMTIHGAGIGLDHAAAFLAQLSGTLRALRASERSTLRGIAIVTDNGKHAAFQRLWFEQRFHGDPDLQRRAAGVYTYRVPSP